MTRIAFAVCLVLAASGLAPAPAQQAPAAKKSAPKPTLAELRRLVAEQRALIEAQQATIAEQQAKLAEQEAKLGAQDAAIEEQRAKLAALETRLQEMKTRLDEMEQLIPGAEEQRAIQERLARVESEEKVPELPPNVVSAGDFPGSIRIPGTDAAVKFGGRIRAASVFTLSPLGSDDRFLTNSIPVEATDEAAGSGRRTRFTANTSRFNFEMRTPTGVGQLRTFIEGDFFGSNVESSNVNFRLRHAYAQFHGFLVGQTWSTFSDPAADHQDMDFEGINGENVIRQAQIRYTHQVTPVLWFAAALETPEVSITGGEGVNVVPDTVGRVFWRFKEIGHLQGAIVLRQIRGEPDAPLTGSEKEDAWGASLSGVVPFRYFNLIDRFIFQLNAGRGIARYINDLNSLGGQDAFFNPLDGTLHPLKAVGFYLDYEHQWKEWERARKMKLRSSLIWSFVSVDNLDFQLPSAYRRTNRYSVNVVFSPIERIDLGVEYIYGTRENNDGNRGNAEQLQIVGIFRF
jgi:outer membrane DcaP-like protein